MQAIQKVPTWVSDAVKKTLEEDRGHFTIRLKIPTVRKYRNPLTGKEMEEFEEEEDRTHETETSILHKMTANDWRLSAYQREAN